MNEPTDKPFHDWVRQTLHTHRPAYNPQDWTRMQRTLRRRRWWRRGAVSGAGLLIVLIISWLAWPATEPKLAGTTAQAKRPTVDKSVSVSARLTPEQSNETTQLTKVVSPAQRAAGRTAKPPITRPVWPTEIEPITAHGPLTVPTNVSEQIRPPGVVVFSSEEMAIQQQMLTGAFGSDSTSYQVLTRNLQQWPNAVVVCDLTSSMYPYSTQLFAWFRQNARTPAVKGIVFFTDCDSLGQQTQPGGPAGRMFVTRERDPGKVLPLMLEAARNTVRNDDDAENDVEALLFAQQTFPEAKHLILLADNLSLVKDMNRLDGVSKPVHVILCGTTGGDLAQPFQPDHYEIASRTKGSLHTIEADINPKAIPRYTMLRVGPHYYRYVARKKQFRLTSFTHRPMRLFGFLWL